MARIRTLEFLPEVFQTPTNSQFLSATLDQLVNPPVSTKMQGYVGSRFGYGVNANEKYVVEPTKTRKDYQLDPGVVFTKPDEMTAKDFISYPGMLDALTNEGALVSDNNKLFTSQFYSWDSFVSLDQIINFNQYYWLKDGLPAVEISTSNVYTTTDYIVTDEPNDYFIRAAETSVGGINPTLTLLRGGTYRFIVNQDSQFWIQGEPGVDGVSPTQPNFSVRLGEENGVYNNGATNGVITFTVPAADAQNEDIKTGNNTVDVVSTIPFKNINGQLLNDVQNIDGVTELEGLTVLFYNTGETGELAYTSVYYNGSPYDTNINDVDFNLNVPPLTLTVTNTTSGINALTVASTSNLQVNNVVTFTGTVFGNINQYNGALTDVIYYVKDILGPTQFTVSLSIGGPEVALTTASGTMTANINEGLYEEGFYSSVNNYFYKITYVENTDDITNPILRLVPYSLIPTNERIVPQYGTQYINIPFYKQTNSGTISKVPYITASLDKLYYQDSSNPNKVGSLRIIENNSTNTLDIYTILGKKNYSIAIPNGQIVNFTNGLKVSFSGDIFPEKYAQSEYYVQGVGTAIELIDVRDLNTPENYTVSQPIPYDSLPFDTTNFDAADNLPETKDYITIARNSLSKNPWSRSNRWFHIDVIKATAEYNYNSNILTEYASEENKAYRPIIEFYPNLKLFNQGTYGKSSVDFIDYRTTDAFSMVNGQPVYYPDVEVYTRYTGTINLVTGISSNSFLIGQTYEIASLGSTDWNYVAGTVGETYSVGDQVKVVATDSGTGTGNPLTYTTITIPTADVFSSSSDNVPISGSFQIGQYISDIPDYTVSGLEPILPSDARILSIEGINTLTITVYWEDAIPATYGTNRSFIANDINNDNYALFNGAKVIFAVDQEASVRDKIYTVTIESYTVGGNPVITLTETSDGNIYENDQTVILRGNFNTGKTFWFDGSLWVKGQQKTDVNQPPLFDIFDKNGISFSNKIIYQGSDFAGNKLFAYELGSGTDDSVLGFPLAYSSLSNTGDISFDVSFNSATFNYVDNTTKQPITLNVSTGYVYNYYTREDNNKLLGWQTAVAPSVQYQLFEFDYTHNYPIAALQESLDRTSVKDIKVDTVQGFYNSGYLLINNEIIHYTGRQSVVLETGQIQYLFTGITRGVDGTVATSHEKGTAFGLAKYSFTCDVKVNTQQENSWPVIQVAVNNKPLSKDSYTVTTTDPNLNQGKFNGSTTVTIPVENIDSLIDTKIEVSLLSDEVSDVGYYSIPINLNNNPFNENLTKTNVGDIRRQYTSIFYNNPNFTGTLFGANNYRDLGNLVPWGDKIIQNSASLAAVGAFNRIESNGVFDALLFNSREYVKYKTLLVDTVNNSEYLQQYNPSEILNNALDLITTSKSQEQSFFWSDMLPSKAPYATNTYTFKNFVDTSYFPLSRTYDYSTANYYGVLVYLTRKIGNITQTIQLIKGVDYIISATSPTLEITKDLQVNDTVTINEYNQTYGSYVPNTPTKLGMYPATIPSVVLDSNYTIPTYFIVGHDGSYNKLYGNYDFITGALEDFRDQALLEFEKRIYNNLKLEGLVSPINSFDFMPSAFRKTDFNYDQWLEIYSSQFLDWVGQNRVDFKLQVYNKSNPWTYNWSNSQSRFNNSVIQQGYWRGLYQYYFDTTTPNSTPWQMLGFANEPNWWEERYGAAPYTINNLILWQDIFDGYIYNNGAGYVNTSITRTDKEKGTAEYDDEFAKFLSVLPVNEAGTLTEPWFSVVGNYNANIFQRDWQVGDMGPTELSYRRSSTWPFDYIRIYALMNPAKFFNLCIDLDNYRYNETFNQYLVNDREHLILDNVKIYGNGTPKTSFINWIVDFQKQQGIDATANMESLLYNLDVRLVYRLAGFSDKTMLKFFVEKATPAATNTSLLIPDASYQVLLYENQPFDKLIYTSVIIQITDEGYKVYGNSQKNAYFTVLRPVYGGAFKTITVDQITVKVAVDYSDNEEVIPYGTQFYSVQDVCQFLSSYGAWTEKVGAKWDTVINGITVDWTAMISEFLYWAQSGWEVSSTINLNPAAITLLIDRESSIVQPLTLQKQNFVLNQNLFPIPLNDLAILREETKFSVSPLNEGDTISYGQFNISNIEHGIVFDNVTEFNDILYNLITGLRQNRVYVVGSKTAEWNGTMFASGFIYNQDNIQEWSKNVRYTKGQIVKFKNKYWTALKIIQPALAFQEKDWIITDYNEISKGLLPNSSTRSYESTLYYNINQTNLESDADLLSFGLIGYRPRDYMQAADLSDVTQVNVYRNLIKNKGTKNAVNAFKGANLPQGGIEYETYENWGILSGKFGGVLNDNFIEMRLQESKLTGNPATVSLTNGVHTPGIQQYIPLNKLFNYSTPITDPNVLYTTSYEPSTVYPDAGYVNYNDVKMSAYYYSQLPNAVNKAGNIVPIEQFYVRDYVWIANYLAKWNVYTPDILNEDYNYSTPPVNVINLRSNLNGTATITFNGVHNLSQYDLIAIINFNASVNGYYTVADIVNPKQITVTFITTNAVNITGQGTCLKFVSQRVDKPSDIPTLPLLSSEFTKNTVWVDENDDGGWAVYRKSLNYQYDSAFNDKFSSKAYSENYGTSVAYNKNIGYLVGDATLGEVYRYDTVDNKLELFETLTGDTSFGTSIAHNNNTFVISQPTTNSKVVIYTWNDTNVTNALLPIWEISAPIGVTNWGTSIALSDDDNWLYISASEINYVYIFKKQNIAYDAGYFNTNQVYEITSLGTLINATEIVAGNTYEIAYQGTTNFTLIGATSNKPGTIFTATDTITGTGTVYADPTDFTAIGAVENKIGIKFIATGAGSGSGTAKQISYEYVNAITGTGLSLGDNFGASIATDYYSETVVVGAPNYDYSGSVENWGQAYVFDRIVQNYEAPFTTVDNIQYFQMASAPYTYGVNVTDVYANNAIQLSDVSYFAEDKPVVFSSKTTAGLTGTGINPYQTYYVASVDTLTNTITIKTTRNTNTEETLVAKAGITNTYATLQMSPLDVTVNGVLVQDNNYSVIGTAFVYSTPLNVGDIISVGTCQFVEKQILNTENTPRTGVNFGTSVDTNTYANEIIVGAPYELDSFNYEGAVHRFTNAAEKYGQITSVTPTNVTQPVVNAGSFVLGETYTIVSLGDTDWDAVAGTTGGSYQVGSVFVAATSGSGTGTASYYRNLLINGYLVKIAGLAETVAETINAAKITNVVASPVTYSVSTLEYNKSYRILTLGTTTQEEWNYIAGTTSISYSVGSTLTALQTGLGTGTVTDGNLIIGINNPDIANLNQQLVISVTDKETLSQLGFEIYTQTQLITCPHVGTQTQFGTVVKFNEDNSFVASAPSATRFSATTFDFIDDENQDNDTIFDNNATRWVDTFPNAGAVYMFDYLSNYNESLSNCGAYVYAQSVNARDITYGNQPRYGEALDFSDNKVVIGAPHYRPDTVDGQVIAYDNLVGVQDWSVYRQSSAIVDINRINNMQIFSAQTNNTLINLDYIDPLQGKIFGSVRQNIDVVSNIDPASYNNGFTIDSAVTWGKTKIGTMWFDTSNIRYINYHQNDPVYNSNYWATLFPGSDPAIYTWVESTSPPSAYTGPGTVKDVNLYNVQSYVNQTNIVQPLYYFWVRNTNTVNSQIGKTLSDTVMEYYIANPQASGIAYMQPLLPNTFGLVNCGYYINANDSILQIGYSTTTGESLPHQEFTLIRADFADDFLPGIPNTTTLKEPAGLYDRLLDSFAGVDEEGNGNVVPNPFLPLAVQSGVLARPRQSFFYNRFKALENYIQYANAVMKQYPIVEMRPSATFLTKSGTNYDVANFITQVDWWATGFDNNTKPAYQVEIYSDLAKLSVNEGTIVRVKNGGSGYIETYQYQQLTDSAGKTFSDWVRIGIFKGTYEINSGLYNYGTGKFGFDGNFFATDSFDYFPSQETYWIIRALNEQIFIEELLIHRNKSLILMFEYITSETNESQNYLPWLTKTSLLDVKHKVRELLPTEKFRTDSNEFLSGYLNEVKPYHVVIKEFILNYTGTDVYEGDLTDFDLPATYNKNTDSFESPELVYGGIQKNQQNQYLPSSDIWQEGQYVNWFDNYGLSLTGQNDYLMTELADYLPAGFVKFAVVKNSSGFPVNGTIKIGEEIITYSGIDRALNLLLNLVRGLDGTTAISHLPNAKIYMDLPQVLLLETGSQYFNPPKVTAYIDLEKYDPPKRPAVLEAVMSLDRVTAINVLDPGLGYQALPEIIIEPSVKINFDSTAVDSELHTIQLTGFTVQTGNLIRYHNGSGTPINFLQEGQWYYIRLIENIPAPTIALYTTYDDAYADQNRVPFTVSGPSTKNQLWLGAKASAVTSSQPVRENIVRFKFDRNSYYSKVTDWKSDSFYGSFFAGDYASQSVASWSLLLDDTQPSINNVLASAQGFVFPIVNVENNASTHWSSFERFVDNFTNDTITLKLSAPVSETTSGSTIGFFKNMPIKFNGPITITGLVSNQTYYVSEIVSDTEFKISATVDGSSITFSTNLTVVGSPVYCYTGHVTNVAEITTIYQGIRTVTASSSTNNAFTIPLNALGTGGTAQLYIGAPVTFTANVFGGIRENENYYVTTVIDSQTFTISETPEPLQFTLLATNSVGNIATLNTVQGISVNTPLIFQNMQILGSSVTDFGNILEGVVYYVKAVDKTYDTVVLTTSYNGYDEFALTTVPATSSSSVNAGSFVIGESYTIESLGTTDFTLIGAIGNIVGIQFVATGVGTGSGTATTLNGTKARVIDQSNVVQLTTATGNATMTIGLPVSPGQVDGQIFTCYQTGEIYGPVTPTLLTNLVERNVVKSLTGSNKLVLQETTSTLSDVYVNMPFTINTTIGGLNPLFPTLETYYVESEGTISITCQYSDSSTIIHCNETYDLYDSMPIVFSGAGLGNIILGQKYYVKLSGSAPYSQFEITNYPGGIAVEIGDDAGLTYGAGPDYLTVTDTLGGSALSLTTSNGPAKLTQKTKFDTNPPSFLIQSILGGYSVKVVDGGEGFTVGNQFVVLGANLGGTTPTNNCIITVDSVGLLGNITNVIVTGNVPLKQKNYYVKVTGIDTFELYNDPLQTVPVSGLDFPFAGFTTTNVTSANPGTEEWTVGDSSGFAEGDAVIFTGEVFGGVTLAQTYYIYDVPSSTSVKITDTPGGISYSPVPPYTGNMTMAKPGGFMMLPEPFTFQASVVRYRTNPAVPPKVYRCVISNNDKEFIFGKWEEIPSGSQELNALDRAVGYYEPTSTMPGLDLPQLFTGLEYPNTTYLGQPFEPNSILPVDTIITDQPFEQKNIDFSAVLYNNTKYTLPANLPKYSALVSNLTQNRWNVGKITQQPINLTDLTLINDVYLMTSDNVATPLMRSDDAITWATNGLDSYSTSSISTLGIGIGNKLLTVGTGLAWDINQEIVISHDLSHSMSGTVVDYDINTGLMTVNISTTTGTGTYNAWDITPKGVGIVVSIPPCRLQSVAYLNDVYVAVGDKIVASNDTYNWSTVYYFDDVNQVTLYDVISTDIPGFTGFVTVGQGVRLVNGDYISTAVILYSTDGSEWTQVSWDNLGSTTNQGFKSLSNDGTYLYAVGTDGVIYRSSDAQTWIGLNETEVTGTSSGNQLSVKSLIGFTVGDLVRFTESFDVLSSSTTYKIRTLSGSNLTLSDELDNLIVLNYSGLPTLPCFMYKYPRPATLNDITYGASLLVTVGDEGTILTSSDGITWTESVSGTEENLNAVNYASNIGQYIAVGDNNTIIKSDDGVTWTNHQVFLTAAPDYTVDGGPFLQGYGPEELVPGTVTDSIQLTVNTRPGSNWPIEQYSHNGYGVVSQELSPISEIQVIYRFNYNETTRQRLVEVPAQVSVSIIDANTGVSRTIYKDLDYTVDWVNQLIILDTPLSYGPSDKLRVDIYNVGNGLQLVQSSTELAPYVSNVDTGGFDEIFLPVNYSAGIEQGNGIVRPYFTPIETIARSTNSVTQLIGVDDVTNFVVGMPISFSGDVFGGITAEAIYYVKTISTGTNSISITTSITNGTPGPTFTLTDASGQMGVVITIGNGLFWTDPIVMKNGNRLTHGVTFYTYRTKATTNTVVSNTLTGIVVGDSITFDNAIATFCPEIIPHYEYTVLYFVDPNEFTLEDPANPGNPLVLSNGYGTAQFITNDYAVTIAQDGINAQMLLAQHLTDVDYVAYSFFGELQPSPLGYTLPETQVFELSGSTYYLDNFAGQLNPENAVVEVDGLRVDIGSYTIYPETNALGFNVAPTGNTVAVTTYNNTDTQYFTTEWAASGIPSTTIIVESTNHLEETFDELPYDTVGYDTLLNWMTLQSPYSTTELTVGQPLVFEAPLLNGVSSNRKYFVTEILNSTDFVISETPGGNPITFTYDTGAMPALTFSVNVANITYINTGIVLPTVVTVTETYSSNNEIQCESVSGILVGNPIEFKCNRITVGQLIVGTLYRIEELGDTNWNAIGYVGTPEVGGLFTASATGSGDGVALQANYGNLDTIGEVYFVNAIDTLNNTIVVENVNGDIVTLSNFSGTIKGIVAGNETTTITTGVPNLLVTNEEVRLDGILGSTQLNGKVFYVHVIDDYTFGIYETPYDPAYNAPDNNPVIGVSSYISGGYAWKQGQFIIIDTNASLTDSVTDRITVASTYNLIANTPVYFSQYAAQIGDNLMGGLTYGTQYFLRDVAPETSATKLKDGYEYSIHYLGSTDWLAVGATADSEFTGSITPGTYIERETGEVKSAAILTVTAVTSGFLQVGQQISGAGISAGTVIDYVITGSGQEGTYALSKLQTVASTTIYGVNLYNTFVANGTNTGDGTGIAHSLNEITVSLERGGEVFELTDASGLIGVTQWQQDNVDRLWVTVNGYRVPSSKLRLYAYNEVGILATIEAGDAVIITSMTPAETPAEERYINFVSSRGEGYVYRVNSQARTWLTEELDRYETKIYVKDITHLTNVIEQTNTVPAAIDGYIYVGLNAHKNDILNVTVYNQTKSLLLSPGQYQVIIENTAPTLKIKSKPINIEEGDVLQITTIEGNTILINGEQIRIVGADLEENTLTIGSRGANGTGVQPVHAKYSTVYGLLAANRMSVADYGITWNPIPGTYNPTEGDPLQIADTYPAIFLKTDIT